MNKIRIDELSQPVRDFLTQATRDGSVVIVDQDGQLQCGITPYFESTHAEKQQALNSLKELQAKVGKSMEGQGVTEDEMMKVLLEDAGYTQPILYVHGMQNV